MKRLVPGQVEGVAANDRKDNGGRLRAARLPAFLPCAGRVARRLDACTSRMAFFCHGNGRSVVWRKFSERSVEGYRQRTFSANEFRPLEFNPEATAFLGDFERIGVQGNDVVALFDV